MEVEAPVSESDSRTMPPRTVTIQLDEFGHEQLSDAARRQGVSIEELVLHAAMYYLADADSGRMATKVFRDRVAERAKGNGAPAPERNAPGS